MPAGILDEDVPRTRIPPDRFPESGTGRVPAYSKFCRNKSIREISDAVPLSRLTTEYCPCHEAPEEKTAEWIEENPPVRNKLRYFREPRKLSKNNFPV